MFLSAFLNVLWKAKATSAKQLPLFCRQADPSELKGLELQLQELHRSLLQIHLLGAAAISVPLKGAGSADLRCWMLPAGHSPHLLWLTKWWGQQAWKCSAHEGGINKVVYPFYVRIKKGGSQVCVLVLNSPVLLGLALVQLQHAGAASALVLPETSLKGRARAAGFLQVKKRLRGEELQMGMEAACAFSSTVLKLSWEHLRAERWQLLPLCEPQFLISTERCRTQT